MAAEYCNQLEDREPALCHWLHASNGEPGAIFDFPEDGWRRVPRERDGWYHCCEYKGPYTTKCAHQENLCARYDMILNSEHLEDWIDSKNQELLLSTCCEPVVRRVQAQCSSARIFNPLSCFDYVRRMLTRTLRTQVPPHNCEELEASECWAHQMVKLPEHSQRRDDRALTTLQACCAEPKHCRRYINQKGHPDEGMEFADENTRVYGDLRNCMVDKRSNCDDAATFCSYLDMLPREELPVEVVTVKNKASICCIPPTCANHAITWCAFEGLTVKSYSTW